MSEALRLADLLDERKRDRLDLLPSKAAAELRRLSAENDALRTALAEPEHDLTTVYMAGRMDEQKVQRKPLTDEEIAAISAECAASAYRWNDFEFARAIERAHGIGGES